MSNNIFQCWLRCMGGLDIEVCELDNIHVYAIMAEAGAKLGALRNMTMTVYV